MAFEHGLRHGLVQRGAGRPVAPETLAVRDFLASVPAAQGESVRQVARSLQLSVGDAHKIVDRLARKGEVREVRRARQAGVKKPVCFYAAAPSAPVSGSCSASMVDVLTFGIVSLD
jgi:hypothetical protein